MFSKTTQSIFHTNGVNDSKELKSVTCTKMSILNTEF